MLALSFLSETSHETDLTWLLWLVLAIFVLIVVVGWLTSGKKKEEAPVEAHAPAHDHHAEETHAEAAADDLTKLEGVGPKVAAVLTEAGYATFAELAAADADKVRAALKDAGLHMMDPAGWIEQAELAAKGDMEGLAKLQDELKGGRRA